MKKKLFLLLLFVVGVVENAISQPPVSPSEDIPIDGGLLFLLIAGIIFAGVVFYKKSDDKT